MDIDDFLDDLLEPTYYDISKYLGDLRSEVETLDQDSLIDEFSGMQHNMVGKEADKIQHLIFKAHADTDLTTEELEFLRDIYVLYYSPVVLIDEKDEDEF